MIMSLKLTHNRMSESLIYISELECTVLDVKVIEGLGTAIDVVLSNDVLREGDRIVVYGLHGATANSFPLGGACYSCGLQPLFKMSSLMPQLNYLFRAHSSPHSFYCIPQTPTRIHKENDSTRTHPLVTIHDKGSQSFLDTRSSSDGTFKVLYPCSSEDVIKSLFLATLSITTQAIRHHIRRLRRLVLTALCGRLPPHWNSIAGLTPHQRWLGLSVPPSACAFYASSQECQRVSSNPFDERAPARKNSDDLVHMHMYM
ncbi:MAG: hypothetical protein J3Q66DRAFT_375465 [Benniella sp.]|nr:MAG: hypothetical protein J3Q66DRAFT_375465 [Benniella sp.]